LVFFVDDARPKCLFVTILAFDFAPEDLHFSAFSLVFLALSTSEVGSGSEDQETNSEIRTFLPRFASILFNWS
jgi:hypothetical protein